VQLDAPQTLYERPVNRFVAQFIGESHFLPVSVSGQRVTFGKYNFALARPPASDAREQLLVIRPEKFKLLPAGASADGLNVIDGQVLDRVYQGESLVLYVELEGGLRVATRQPTQQSVLSSIPEKGQRVGLAFDPADTVVVPAEGSQ